MKILFLLILHHFGDIQPVVIPAKSKAEACIAMKSWTNPRSIGASSYAAEVFAVEGIGNGSLPDAFIYQVSCENGKFDSESAEYAATVGTGCRQFLSAQDEIKYLEGLGANLDTDEIVRDHANKRIASLRAIHNRKADWKKYFQCVAERTERKMTGDEYIDFLDSIDKRIKKMENEIFLLKGKKP